MKSIQSKIQLIESQIKEESQTVTENFLITEMKKIGIEKLPYSYSSLKSFIDPETMNVHYNKHYKGYVDKLNAALSKKKFGDLDLEQIVQSITKFSKDVRNNAGGAYNHALFWKMLSPKPQKPKRLVSARIDKDFGDFPSFKKKFNEVSKEKFGSGWVWLIVTDKNKLKIVSSSNQDNPLMNDFEGGGYPILGLDLWEHAYYLKYKNRRDEYVKNFWNVVNWDFVESLYKMKVETKINESIVSEMLLEQDDSSLLDIPVVEACNSRELNEIKSTIFQHKLTPQEIRGGKKTLKSIVVSNISNLLKKQFPNNWKNETRTHMSGVYRKTKGETVRSLLNNLTSSYTALCALVKYVNAYLTSVEKDSIKFGGTYEENLINLETFFSALDSLRQVVFNPESEINKQIGRILTYSDCIGKRNETAAKQIIDRNLGENSCKLTSGLGLKKDAFGTDCTIDMEGGTKEAQVKPFTRIVEGEGKIKILGSSSVQLYKVPLFVFVNVVDKVVLIFENSGLDVSSGSYVFPAGSLIHSFSTNLPLDLEDCSKYK
jgi:Fe-Mn family superoxide dismutase